MGHPNGPQGASGLEAQGRRLTMRQCSKTNGERTMGLDVGDRHSRYCILDGEGEIVEEGRVVTSERTFRERFGRMERARIAIEVGTHSPWVKRVLEDAGHEVLVANARRVRLISENNNKTDKVDAESLARLGRVDPKLLSPIQHRAPEKQADLAMLRARDTLVKARTEMVNHVRGAVKPFAERVPPSSAESFPRAAATHIPAEIRMALKPLLGVIQGLTKIIREYDRRIEEMASQRYPETKHLQQVSGVGSLTSVAFVLTLGDPGRFRRSRDVGPYLGLRPRRSDSGEREPQLRITKAGDRTMRRLLVGSAHYILGPFGPDTDLRRWGRRLAERGGKNAKKRAVVAVARKLSVLLHRLWVTGATYEPLRSPAQGKETNKVSA